MEYYSTTKRNEVLTRATIWMNLSNNILKKPETNGWLLYSIFYEMSRIGKSMKTESRLVVIRAWWERKNGE